MKLTLQELATLVGGSAQGDAAKVLTGAAGLENAGETDITFLKDAKNAAELEKTRAGVVLVPEGLPAGNGQNRVVVAQPQVAFAKVLTIIEKERRPLPTGIHASAVIHPTARVEPGAAVGALTVIEAGAKVGAGTVIYPQCYIGAESVIGRDCILYPQVVVRERCTIGDRVILHPGATIGADGYGFVTAGGKHHKLPQVGVVVIEDDVELGAQTCVDRAALGETRIGAGTKTDNFVQLAHNVKVGKHNLYVCQAGLGGSTTTGDYVVFAGAAAASDHITIGDKVVVLAKSGVTKDVPAGSVISGMPARPVREYLKREAQINKLGDLFDDVKALKAKNP